VGRDILLPKLNVGAGWGGASMSRPGRFISGKENHFPFRGMWVSFEAKLDGFRKSCNILTFEPQNFSP